MRGKQAPDLAFIIPTHNRQSDLITTILKLESLDSRIQELNAGAELLIVDNASESVPDLPSRLANGIRTRVIRLDSNQGAAARNIAVQETDAPWVFMLDDDSSPLDLAPIVHAMRTACDSTAAVATTITLPGHTSESPMYESGGLPAVPVGCSVLYRRCAFLKAGGYDQAFHYYVEEYDLAAKLLRDGWRIVFDPAIRTEHRKVSANRDLSRIVQRLTRNNAWVIQRYAPAHMRNSLLTETLSRYKKIAEKEGALDGYLRAEYELEESLHEQHVTPLGDHAFDLFTGKHHVREHLNSVMQHQRVETVCLSTRGKNVRELEAVLQEYGIQVTMDMNTANRIDAVLMPGTLSPGPILSECFNLRCAYPSNRIELPWDPSQKQITDLSVASSSAA